MRNLYTITTARPIPQLGGISGPVTTPTKLDTSDVLSLVRSGFEVYQHNPSNKTEKVKVTVRNFNSIKFSTSRIEAVERRILNRSIQEMENDMKVEVTTKKPKKNEEKEEKKPVTEKILENMNEEKKVTKPDAFSTSNK